MNILDIKKFMKIHATCHDNSVRHSILYSCITKEVLLKKEYYSNFHRASNIYPKLFNSSCAINWNSILYT